MDSIYPVFARPLTVLMLPYCSDNQDIYGVAGNLLKWFRSYLSGRLQHVRVRGTPQDDKCVIWSTSRVPHLAPVSFSAFIDGIHIRSLNYRFLLYAGDLKKLFIKIGDLIDCPKLQGPMSVLFRTGVL